MSRIKLIKERSNSATYFMHVHNMNYLPNAHRELEISIVLSGEIRVTVEGKEFDLIAGDVVFVREYAIHSYTTDDESVILGCSFRKDCSHEIERYVEDHYPESFVYQNQASKGQILNLASWINQTHAEATDIQRLAYLFFVFGYLDVSKMTRISRTKTDKVVLDAMQYIDENVNKQLNLDQISKDLGVSKYHLSHLFKNSVGITIMNYATRIKLAGAKRLLIESDETIEKIANILGFGSLRSFNRVFKDYIGYPPTTFRRIHKEKSMLEISTK